jgi:hypothetical protein
MTMTQMEIQAELANILVFGVEANLQRHIAGAATSARLAEAQMEVDMMVRLFTEAITPFMYRHFPYEGAPFPELKIHLRYDGSMMVMAGNDALEALSIGRIPIQFSAAIEDVIKTYTTAKTPVPPQRQTPYMPG